MIGLNVLSLFGKVIILQLFYADRLFVASSLSIILSSLRAFVRSVIML